MNTPCNILSKHTFIMYYLLVHTNNQISNNIHDMYYLLAYTGNKVNDSIVYYVILTDTHDIK